MTVTSFNNGCQYGVNCSEGRLTVDIDYQHGSIIINFENDQMWDCDVDNDFNMQEFEGNLQIAINDNKISKNYEAFKNFLDGLLNGYIFAKLNGVK